MALEQLRSANLLYHLVMQETMERESEKTWNIWTGAIHCAVGVAEATIEHAVAAGDREWEMCEKRRMQGGSQD